MNFIDILQYSRTVCNVCSLTTTNDLNLDILCRCHKNSWNCYKRISFHWILVLIKSLLLETLWSAWWCLFFISVPWRVAHIIGILSRSWTKYFVSLTVIAIFWDRFGLIDCRNLMVFRAPLNTKTLSQTCWLLNFIPKLKRS